MSHSVVCPTIPYRADIDGLRALAVLPVVFFHVGFPAFGGGFVGVDVFFVISGYLITSLVCAEIDAGRFSIAAFYERRVRRIFPALVLVLLMTTALAVVILMPHDLKLFARSLVAAASFLSNVELWQESGYFDTAAERKPLLHTWSLAVEEQFYLFFPPLLLVAARLLKRRYFVAIAPLFGVSLLLSVWGVRNYAAASFFLLPTRIWELLLGALLGLPRVPRPLHPLAADVLYCLGLGMIAGSVFFYSASTPFPGMAALLPCGGTGLIIYAGSQRSRAPMITRLLSLPPLVFLGRISYSLYLWHWPLFVFMRAQLARDLNSGETGALLAASLSFAVLSWRYVEQPFRGRRGILRQRALFANGALAMVIAASLGVMINVAQGFPQRFSPEVLLFLRAADEQSSPTVSASGVVTRAQAAGSYMRLGNKEVPSPRFILWGDSHAGAVSRGVASAAASHGEAVWFASQNACAPLLGVSRLDREVAGRCEMFNEQVHRFVRERDIRTVILVARWALLAESTRYGSEGGSRAFLGDALSSEKSAQRNKEVLERGFMRTIRALRSEGRRVVVIAGVPEIRASVPETVARNLLRGRSTDIGPSLEEYNERQKFVLGLLRRLQEVEGIEVVYPSDYLCRGGRCRVTQDGQSLYGDDDHLSSYGASLLREAFDPLFMVGQAVRPAESPSEPSPAL